MFDRNVNISVPRPDDGVAMVTVYNHANGAVACLPVRLVDLPQELREALADALPRVRPLENRIGDAVFKASANPGTTVEVESS